MRNAMLKITAIDDEHQRTLILEGRLVEPWVAELERSWSEALQNGGTRTTVIDLKDVIAISQGGEELLFQMMAEGATFNCCRGVLTKHILEQLERRREARETKSEEEL